jgi:two-component system, OmpR family, sensor histidine kinase MprB
VNPLARWWSRRSLHARLSLLVTVAVTATMVIVAVLAFAAVFEIQRKQVESQLAADAQTIAAQPEAWRVRPPAANPFVPDPSHAGGGGAPPWPHHVRDLGASWQILDRNGAVLNRSASALPVTDGAKDVATGRRPSVEERVGSGDASLLMLTVPAAGGGAVQVAVALENNLHTLTLFGVLLIVACALGIAGAALLGRTVARAGLKPVQRLTGAVENVAVTMNLDRPIPVSGADEIARLGRSVNTLLAAIGAARQAQRTLVEDAGHELRTPLTSIRTNIELLAAVDRRPELAHRLPPHERSKLLRDLEGQVEELTTLTTELVELARDEATRERTETVDLAEVVEAALERVRMRAPALTFTAALSSVPVDGRPGELERMVLNVLDNAAKWSPPDGTVTATLAPVDDGWCVVTIADTGPGIDEADRPHVFDRFYRAAAARSMPGSGLGLAIVAQTAAQHGGTVTVQPNTPHGTMVTIALPRSSVR